jgi:hypothetical protein
MITHVVLFRFRDRSSAHLSHCQSLLDGLPAKITVIRHLETGLNVVPSDRAYDLCLIIHFDSLDDLATYQSHPDHVEVATYLRSAAESVASVDYATVAAATGPDNR